jgi:hypothetical protein
MAEGFDYLFFIEVLTGGLPSGVMYSLVAIGFVLIYKTSGVLNFAQGAMLLFAALTFVSLVERGVPFALALALTFGIMVLLGMAVERAVLRIMMMSGYTLGFFFPKQVKHMAVMPPKLPSDRKAQIESPDLNETRPDADFESREVPASFYFYRYF